MTDPRTLADIRVPPTVWLDADAEPIDAATAAEAAAEHEARQGVSFEIDTETLASLAVFSAAALLWVAFKRIHTARFRRPQELALNDAPAVVLGTDHRGGFLLWLTATEDEDMADPFTLDDLNRDALAVIRKPMPEDGSPELWDAAMYASHVIYTWGSDNQQDQAFWTLQTALDKLHDIGAPGLPDFDTTSRDEKAAWHKDYAAKYPGIAAWQDAAIGRCMGEDHNTPHDGHEPRWFGTFTSTKAGTNPTLLKDEGPSEWLGKGSSDPTPLHRRDGIPGLRDTDPTGKALAVLAVSLGIKGAGENQAAFDATDKAATAYIYQPDGPGADYSDVEALIQAWEYDFGSETALDVASHFEVHGEREQAERYTDIAARFAIEAGDMWAVVGSPERFEPSAAFRKQCPAITDAYDDAMDRMDETGRATAEWVEERYGQASPDPTPPSTALAKVQGIDTPDKPMSGDEIFASIVAEADEALAVKERQPSPPRDRGGPSIS